MLDATGERLVPDVQHGSLIHAEHLARYLLAARLAPGRRVLDAACGEGYGTALLRDAGALEAVGVDIAPEAVAHARERHGVEAKVGDVLALPFEDASFSLVVSFETIEHVADPLAALDELRRVLEPDGLLVVSTPNPAEYLVGSPFHVRELTPDEFLSALRERFGAVRTYLQHNHLASVVAEAHEAARTGDRELDVHALTAVAPGHELYCVAVCGGAEPLPELRGTVVTAAIDEAHALTKHVEGLEAYLKDFQERTERAEARVAAIEGSASWRAVERLRALRARVRR